MTESKMTAYSRRDFIQNGIKFGAAMVASSRNVFAGKKKAAPSPTGYVHDDRYLEHKLFGNHPESPARLIAIQKAMRRSDLIEDVLPLPLSGDPLAAIKLIHTRKHIDNISARFKKSAPIAELAVKGSLCAVQAVSEGVVRNAFCSIRPPGHHAENTGREEGFCFYNNVAVAAKYAQQVLGYKKILIIDWDYHHGNGTETAFYSDPSVLFFSTHDKRAYPGTGKPSRRGKGDGEGYNINVHLNCGAKDRDVLKAFDDILIPAAEDFKPDFILISAGFDSRKNDLLGCFRFTDIGFLKLTKRVMKLADSYCDGRIVSLLEGGYNVEGLANAVVAHVSTLAGKA
ncbi:MAG: histone deacetylase [Chitinivibrionales bacterium]|nr:histone deacetylase [Chitinivibrionales bacterium]